MPALFLTVSPLSGSRGRMCHRGIMVSKERTAAVLIVSIVWLSIGWFPLMGLKVLKPSGGSGSDPCSANIPVHSRTQGFIMSILSAQVSIRLPKTKLNQSGDVDSGEKRPLSLSINGSAVNTESVNKKLSLKIMTLNNKPPEN